MDEETKDRWIAVAETFQRLGVAFGVTVALWVFIIWATTEVITAIW